MARVIGSEHVDAVRASGRVVLEILPGDIVTDMAVETAARVGIKLVDGPLEKPAVTRTDGNTSMRRALTRRAPRWVAPRAAVVGSPRRFGKLALVGAGGVGMNVAHLAANDGPFGNQNRITNSPCGHSNNHEHAGQKMLVRIFKYRAK